MNYFVSDTSLIRGEVTIGLDSRIWHFCNIYGEKDHPVIIGKNTQIGSFCEIKPGAVIGDFCRLQSYIFIPEDIKIEDYVFIGPKVTFTNEKYPSAKKAVQNEIQDSFIPEGTNIKRSSIIGASSVIGPGISIGEKSVIGMGSVITKDVEPYSVIIKYNQKIGDIRDKKFKNKYLELLI
jgi:UDP-2-acetamido-3-amino-2,3-dideoxy-glucuronate N-acetyltransferase